MIWRILLLLAALGYIGMLVYRTIRFVPPKEERRRPSRAPAVAEMPIALKLSDLVKIPTVSFMDGKGEDQTQFTAFQERLHTLYPKVAARCERMIVGGKGIVYRWPGKSGERPCVLMSHYDVVPAPDEKWIHPPFSGAILEGYVWGRGTIDTKCTLAAAMEAAEQLISAGHVPQNDLYLCFSGDEEVAGPTAPAILEALQEAGVKPWFVLDEGGGIVTDALPGVNKPCAQIGASEKGQAELIFSAEALPGHASRPPRHTALGRVAQAIRRVEMMPWPLRYTPVVKKLIDTMGRHARLPWRIVYANLLPLKPFISLLCGLRGGELNAQLRTTAAFTMANASTATNVLPQRAQASANTRMLPGENSKSAKRRAQRIVKGLGVKVDTRVFSEPSPISRTDDEAWQTLCEAVEDVWPEAVPVPFMYMACTDSRHYSRVCEHVYRFSALSWTREERALMHSFNERISMKALAKMQAFYQVLIQKL